MTKIAAKVEGTARFQEQLKALGTAGRQTILDTLTKAAVDMQADVIESVQAHLSQGRTYRRGKVEHVASLPGFPWNTDTGAAVASIFVSVDETRLEAKVGSNSDVVKWLETGTKRMEARPTFGPALKRARDNFRAKLKFRLDMVK